MRHTFTIIVLFAAMVTIIASRAYAVEVACPGLKITFVNSAAQTFRFDIKTKYNENALCGIVRSPKIKDQSDEIELAYIRYPALQNPETATTLIFINGGPGQENYLHSPYLMKLRDQYTLVFYDSRGTGKSVLSLEDAQNCAIVNTENGVRDLDALITAVSPKRPVFLWSHSYGGIVAKSYAALHLQNVSRLLLHGSEGNYEYAVQAMALGNGLRVLPMKMNEFWIYHDKNSTGARAAFATLVELAKQKRLDMPYQGVTQPWNETALLEVAYASISKMEGSLIGPESLKKILAGDEYTKMLLSNNLGGGIMANTYTAVLTTYTCAEMIPLAKGRINSKFDQENNNVCERLRPACKATLPDLKALDKKLSVPTLLVLGEKDTTIDPTEIAATQARIKNSSVVRINSGHMIEFYNEAAELFRKAPDYFQIDEDYSLFWKAR